MDDLELTIDLDEPTTITVEHPDIPVLGIPEPVSTDLLVLPLPGPPGQPGQPGASGGIHEHVQLQPASVWTITHNLGRMLVGAQVFSLDYGIQWEGVTVQPLDDSTVRLSFDDPTSGVALIL